MVNLSNGITMTKQSKEIPALLRAIHNSDRHIVQNNICGFPSRLCLLDYLDCPDLFITDTGFIWSRKQIVSNNRDRYLYRNYINQTYPDRYCRLPWVVLPTANRTKIWLPVIQLLGWSFYPYPDDLKQRYYYLRTGSTLHANNIIGSTKKDFSKVDKHSQYFSYIDSIYDKLLDDKEIVLD